MAKMFLKRRHAQPRPLIILFRQRILFWKSQFFKYNYSYCYKSELAGYTFVIQINKCDTYCDNVSLTKNSLMSPKFRESNVNC